MINSKVRARVISVEEQQVVLGVYLEGLWHRIPARTEVQLQPGMRIEGQLVVPPDGSLVLFKVFGEITEPQLDEPEPSASNGGLDVEA